MFVYSPHNSLVSAGSIYRFCLSRLENKKLQLHSLILANKSASLTRPITILLTQFTHRTFLLWVHPGRLHGSCWHSSSCSQLNITHPHCVKYKSPYYCQIGLLIVKFIISVHFYANYRLGKIKGKTITSSCSHAAQRATERATATFVVIKQIVFSAAAFFLLHFEEDFKVPHLQSDAGFLPAFSRRQTRLVEGGRTSRKWNQRRNILVFYKICMHLSNNLHDYRKTLGI